MRRYGLGDDVGVLEPWGFDNSASDYVIVAGEPRVSGRLDAGGPGEVTRAGIWRCTVGAFECTEQGDEMMTVLAGRCRIDDLATGETLDLRPGDTAFLSGGARVRWTVTEDVTKAFLGWSPDGF